jgi:putative membrane protein
MGPIKSIAYQPATAGEVSPNTTRLTLEVERSGLEQAIMDWIRTSISLITFGFTIYKFFQMERGPAVEPERLVGPRGFAIALIALGIVSLAFATFQHLRGMKALRAQYVDHPPPRSLASFVSVFVSVLGLVALLLAIFGQ